MLPIKRNVLVTSLVLGVAYGLVAYFAFERHASLPTVAFLALVPLAIGAIPLLISDLDQIRSYVFILFVPWITILAVFAVLAAVLREGVLCLLVLGAPFYLSAMLGTLIATIIRAIMIRREKRKAAAAALMLLPFLLAGVEQRYLVREAQVTVGSSTVIDAPAALVFDRLAEVPTMRDDEYQPGLFNKLGVPRPIRATVDRKAEGGHRTGEFTRGLTFQETITTYDAPRRMTFDIAVDPRALLPGSTERHALEGGYFRFVDATYTLDPVGDGRVKLTLSSRYVARSSVNAYGKLWADAILGDFQDRVLAVIKRRCETRPAEAPTEVAATR
ncbi:MAG: SRPBCC family protein [Minicystis sp.]